MDNTTHSFDETRLASYLENHIEGFQGPLSAKKFAGGQSNPTFLITTADARYVLRRKPPGQLLQSAHAIDREYAVLQALFNTTVPVARPFCLCEDESIIGGMFYVMSYAQGQIFWDPSLPELKREERGAIFDELIRVMAAMHDLDVNLVGLGDHGRPGSYFQRQLDRWSKQYRATATERREAMETLMHWLVANLPADDGQLSLIHGDYRIDNIIFDGSSHRAIAVLDWELSTLGHPLADLAYFCMGLRLPPMDQTKGLGGLDRDQLGVPQEREIISRYCELRRIDHIQDWTFYLAFSFFRLAAILQGVLKRALDGNASNDRALQVGRMTGTLVQMAVDLISNEE